MHILCADIAQSVEHILGKDEVSGSSPDISSKQIPIYRHFGDFCFALRSLKHPFG